MEDFKYRIQPSNYRATDFRHPCLPDDWSHRVDLFFIYKNPEYDDYLDDEEEFFETALQFTYWGEKFPDVEEALPLDAP